MKLKITRFLIIGIIIQLSFSCKSSEIKQVDMDDILEEELRADPEPFREIKEKDLQESNKKQNKRDQIKR